MNCATTHPDFVIPVTATKSRCLKCWLVFAPMTPNPGFAGSGAKKKGPTALPYDSEVPRTRSSVVPWIRVDD